MVKGWITVCGFVTRCGGTGRRKGLKVKGQTTACGFVTLRRFSFLRLRLCVKALDYRLRFCYFLKIIDITTMARQEL